MAERAFVMKHDGRQSSVSVQANVTQLETFRSALLNEEFKMVSQHENRWVFRRDIRLIAGDWPIKLVIRRQGKHSEISRYEISFFMFIPWAWIIGLGIMIVLFLPLAKLQGAPLALLLAVGVIALAIYKQRLDFTPDASWQGPPRKQWNEKMARLLGQAFAGEAK